jgi:hypothetical protein
MQNKHQHNNKKGSKISLSGNKGELDQVANQLDGLAHHKLRDGQLGGILSGYEADIRQESVLMALDWYVRGQPQNAQGAPSGGEWHAPRALAGALRIIKLRFTRKLAKQPGGGPPASAAALGVVKHPIDELEHEWPEHRVRVVVREGISRSLKAARITHGNAIIARMVLCEGEPVSKVAKHCGVHRSAIYQHVSKVRKAITPLMKSIEVPYCD